MKKLITTLSALALTAMGCGTSTAPTSSTVAAAPTFAPPDPGLFDDPYVVTALKSYQRNFQGALELTTAVSNNIYLPATVPPGTLTLADVLHKAWKERTDSACKDLIDQLTQEIRKEFAQATLGDVQCSINSKAIHAAKFTPVLQSGGTTSGRERHLLDIRLINRANVLNFTIMNAPAEPRYLLEFNLDTSIAMELSRGAPSEAGSPLQVRKATTTPWAVKVSSGNAGAHFGQFFFQINNQIAAGLNNRAQDLTGMISKNFSGVLPLGEQGKTAFFRSELTAKKFEDGFLPFLVIRKRFNQAPLAVKVEPYRDSMYISWKLPGARAAAIERFTATRINDNLKFSWNSTSTSAYVTALQNQTNSFELCTVNEWGESFCAPVQSGQPYGAAVLPDITMKESATSVAFSWPAWNDPNARGELTLLRDPESTELFPLFDAGGFVAANFRQGGKYSYQFCVESFNGSKTCKTFEFTRPGAVQSGLRRPLYFAGNSNYCAGVAESNTADGTPLVIWTCMPGLLDQNFAFFSDGSLRDWNSNKCLTVVGEGTQREIVIKECTGAGDQQWEKTVDSTSVVRNIGTNLCMYASGTSLNYPENKVWAKPCLESQGWLWYFRAPIL